MLQFFQHTTELAIKTFTIIVEKKSKSNNSKFSAFVFFALLRLFFILNPAVVCLWRHKNVTEGKVTFALERRSGT